MKPVFKNGKAIGLQYKVYDPIMLTYPDIDTGSPVRILSVNDYRDNTLWAGYLSAQEERTDSFADLL